MFSNTISFDAHVLQMFPPLTVGACLIIAKPMGHVEPAYIVDLILKYQVTGFGFTVPTLVSRTCSICMPEEYGHLISVNILPRHPCVRCLQAREYVIEWKLRNEPPYHPMRAWGVGGESVPADVVRQMHEVSSAAEQMHASAVDHQAVANIR